MSLHALHWTSTFEGAAFRESYDVGPTAVILLHGLGDTADVWRPLMARWRPPARVVALDLPGHGRSPWLEPDAYSAHSLANHVAATFDEHAIRRPLLIGHSLGARICIDLAARPSLNTQGCILIDMGADAGEAVGPAISSHIDAVSAGRDTLDGLIALILDRLPLADPDAVAIAVPAMATLFRGSWRVPLDPAIKRLLAPTANEDIWQALFSVVVSTAIIRGAYSAVLDREGAIRVAGAIPRQPVPIHEIKMAGHAIPLEQPELLAQAIDACLAAMARAN